MKLSLLFEGWEELGIEDPSLSNYKWVYAEAVYHHDLEVNEVLDLIKRLVAIKGYDVGNISLVPGTIEDNEDPYDKTDMKTIQVDIEIEPRFMNDLHKAGHFDLWETMPSWMSGYQNNDSRLVEVRFESELNS